MALHKSCIILPINSWFEDGARRTGNECLSFRAIVSILTVTLTWDSNDDLDLFVVEPNGQEVFFQNQSEKGRLLKDANRRSCRRSTRMRGRETVVYRKGIMEDRGLYRVFVDHTTSCGVKAQTKWTLRVTLRGVVLKYVEGVSTFNFGSVIEGSQIQFTV